MQTILCFIRHGETNWNQQTRIQGKINNPLNENGRNQAKHLGHYFLEHDSNWDVLISSPLIRAHETAEIIRSLLNLSDIIVEDDFSEREFGLAEGEVITDALFDKIVVDQIEGLESSKDIQKRVMNATLRIAKRFEGKRILIVAHSHVIKALLTQLDQQFSFRDKMKNSAISYFKYEKETIQLIQANIEAK